VFSKLLHLVRLRLGIVKPADGPGEIFEGECAITAAWFGLISSSNDMMDITFQLPFSNAEEESRATSFITSPVDSIVNSLP
jgi:hypothetical protein